MEQQALGLIEVVGLTAAIEAADVACKAADVSLVGYELTRGMGMVTIKLLGRVGAANAAVAAAAAAASRINRVVSTRVIPRPDPQLVPLIRSGATSAASPAQVVARRSAVPVPAVPDAATSPPVAGGAPTPTRATPTRKPRSRPTPSPHARTDEQSNNKEEK